MEEQTPGEFMVMRRRRRKNPSSIKKGRHHVQSDSRSRDSTGSMSSFIQSALVNTDSHATPEHPRVSVQVPVGNSSAGKGSGGKKTGLGSGTRKSGANISAKKSISRAKKKLRLDSASRNWEVLMTEKWPDDKDSALNQSIESDIDSYSDAEECTTQLGDEDSDSDDIQDQTCTSPPPSSTPLYLPSGEELPHSVTGKKRQPVGRLRKLQTSTPLYQYHQEQKNTLENIEDDFDSRSSDGDHVSVDQSHSLHDFIVSTTKALKESSSGQQLPRPIFNATDCSDNHLDIVSLPSSSDDEQSSTMLGITDLNRTKTSDWVKQLHIESMESNQSHDVHSSTLNETMKTPCDSAKKRRGRKLVVGGLAEQLQKLIKHESSEITFWEHKAKKLDEKDTDSSSCLTIHVLSLVNCYSLFVAACRVLQGNAQPQTPHTFSATMEHSPMTDISEPSSTQNKIAPSLSLSQYPSTLCSRSTAPESENERYTEAPDNDSGTCSSSKLQECNDSNGTVIVFFSQRSAKHLGLCVGSHVRIHPPWQCLHLPTLSQDVILCTHFCQLVGHTHVPTNTTHTSPIPCKQKGVTGIYSLLSPEKSPLVAAYPMLRRSPMKGLVPTRLFADGASVSGLNLGSTSRENRTLTVSSCDTAMDLLHCHPCHATKAPPLCVMLGALEYAHGGVLAAVNVRILRVYRRKVACGVDGGSHEDKWSLLLCDASGTFAELLVSDYSTNSQWCDLVRTGQSRAVTLTNLKLTKKTNAARNPELLSLVQYLNGQLSTSTAKSANNDTTTQCVHLALPMSCYVLKTQSDSEILDCNDDQLPQLVEQPSCSFPSVIGSSERQPSRVSLLARVVHTHIEVPLLPIEDTGPPVGTLPIPITYQCGYYLFVVIPTHTDTPQLLRVYLKTGFSVSGLEKVLVTPSSELLLRDVRCQTLADGEICYSIDACSLIIPMSCQDPEQVYPVMPPFVATRQLSMLSHLSTPPLPLLSPTTAAAATLVSITDGYVVGVDEENAYSWPVCDTCGSEKLGPEEDTTSELYCEVCQRVVMSPTYQMQLSVFISINHLTVLVQLLQDTIHQLLPVSTTNINLGFDVHCILNKAISLKSCYILGIQDTESGPCESILSLEEVDVAFPS